MKRTVFWGVQGVFSHFCVGGSTHDHENRIKMIGRWFCIVWAMKLKKCWNRPKSLKLHHKCFFLLFVRTLMEYEAIDSFWCKCVLDGYAKISTKFPIYSCSIFFGIWILREFILKKHRVAVFLWIKKFTVHCLRDHDANNVKRVFNLESRPKYGRTYNLGAVKLSGNLFSNFWHFFDLKSSFSRWRF